MHGYYRVPRTDITKESEQDLMHIFFNNGVFNLESYLFLFYIVKVVIWVTVPQLNAVCVKHRWNFTRFNEVPPPPFTGVC